MVLKREIEDFCGTMHNSWPWPAKCVRWEFHSMLRVMGMGGEEMGYISTDLLIHFTMHALISELPSNQVSE